MKIIVDAFGGDHAPLAVIEGCRQAVDELGAEILLTGDEEKIRQAAAEAKISLDGMEIVHAPSVIPVEEDPTTLLKKYADSSMAVGLRLLSEGKGEAFVSAGSTGALVVGSTLIVKRIPKIKRPAFAPIMPKNEGFFMLIDGGANVESKPEMLQQFGVMGSIYMEKVMGVKNPRVGLANVGTEDHKGGELQHQAFQLLKQTGVNFIGNIEARDIPEDAADVVVCDGFTGNVILKLYEGVAMTLMNKIKGILTKNLKTKIAAGMIYSDMKELKRAMDYNEYGGAPIMGVAKPVFKAHGSAKAKTFKNALRLTAAYVKGGVVEEINESLQSLKGMDSNE